MERGVDGVARDGKLVVSTDPLLPSHRLGTLKQCLKVCGPEGVQHQQHPRAAAQIDVEPRDVRLRAAAEYSSVFHPHVGKPQLLHFVAHQLFKPQQTGYGKIQHKDLLFGSNDFRFL